MVQHNKIYKFSGLDKVRDKYKFENELDKELSQLKDKWNAKSKTVTIKKKLPSPVCRSNHKSNAWLVPSRYLLWPE